MSEKLKIVEMSNTKKKEYDTFVENFPQDLSSERLIDKLSKFAIENPRPSAFS